MRLATTAACFALMTTSAFGATIELNFNEIELLPNSKGLDGGFPEHNYTLSAETGEPSVSSGSELAALNDISSNITGFDNSVQRLTLSRSDGKTFDLESFYVSRFYSGLETTYDAARYDPTGEKQYSYVLSDTIRTIFDAVQVDAVNRLGQTISASATPVDFTDLSPGRVAPYTGKLIDASTLDGNFTDLVSLTFTSNYGPSYPVECSPENLIRVSAFFSLFEPCGDRELDVTEFDVSVYTVASLPTRNDASNYTLGQITVSDSLAPVPLPAGFFMLGLALGSLSVSRRLSKRNT